MAFRVFFLFSEVLTTQNRVKLPDLRATDNAFVRSDSSWTLITSQTEHVDLIFSDAAGPDPFRTDAQEVMTSSK